MRRHLAALALAFFVSIPLHAAITGFVMNGDGQPVVGAKVESFALETEAESRARLAGANPAGKALTSAASDARGKFTLESPKETVAVLRVRADGYAPTSMRVERDDDAGAIVLTQAAAKTGRVTAGGKPVAGATVVWTGMSEWVTTTDEQGRYTVPDPSKWASSVTVFHRDYAIDEEFAGMGGQFAAGRGRRGQRTAGAAPASEAVDRTLNAGTAVSGTVVAEDGKTPVAGAAIAIDAHPVATTAENGTFSIPHVPSKWELIVASSGSLIGSRARTPGAAAPLTIKLGKGASISGSVRDTRGQSPVAGAEVRLRVPMRMGGQSWSAITDSKGAYVISGVLPGSYQVNALRPGYSVLSLNVALTAGEKANKPLVATQLARVSGTVVDEQKRPVAAARLAPQVVSRGETNFPMFVMMSSGMPQSAASAPDGTFTLRTTTDADIEIAAAKKGFPSVRSTKLHLAPGERKAGLILTIPSGVAVSGRVLDKEGKPVAGVTVVAAEAAGGGGNMARRMVVVNSMRSGGDEPVKTAPDGTFSIRVKEGTYDFAFKADGFATKSLRAVQVTASLRPLEVTLDPGVEITGRVVRAGAGVEGVSVSAFGDGGPVGTETAADGSFRLADLSPGQMMLSAMKQDEFIQQVRPVTAPASDVVIEVPAGARISGRVLDKTTKEPVTAFDAGVSRPMGGGGMMIVLPAAMRHFTSDDGSFVLENVPAGQTQVVVEAPGYTTARVPGITVEAGRNVADVEVDMDHGVRAVGHVTGPDGSPLAGVSVRLDGGRGVMNFNPMQQGSVTDANGDFTMESVEAGDKTFVFSRSGYLTTQKSASLSGSETRVDAQLSSGTRASGVVVTDGGVPLADANVMAQSAADSSFGMRSTRTDANGNFEFEALSPGRYNFSASKSGYADGRLRDFDVTAGAPVRIVMTSGGVIYGRITGLSADELQRATVSAQSASGNASAPVDATGSFRMEGAPLGTVRVAAMVGGGIGGSRSSPQQSVQVDAGSQVEVNIAFKTDTVVSGRVSRNGQAVGGAMVSFSPKDATAQTRASTTTDSNGRYEVSGLDDATYNVTVVDLQRSAPFSSTYQVRGSGTFDVDMKAAAMRGHVTDSDGNAVAEAIVEMRDSGSDSGMRLSRTTQTDAGGSFVIENVPAGAYSVSATKTGYGTRAVSATVGDSDASVEISIARNAGVQLRVVDGRNGQLLNAQVHVTNAQNVTVYDTPFFGGGAGADVIKLPLEAGSYNATIRAMGYAPQSVSLTSPSSPTVALTPGGTIAIQSKGSGLRRARLLTASGQEYARGGFGGSGIFTVDPSPGVTVLGNVAPGAYTIQILGEGSEVTSSAPVTVVEGQTAQVSL